MQHLPRWWGEESGQGRKLSPPTTYCHKESDQSPLPVLFPTCLVLVGLSFDLSVLPQMDIRCTVLGSLTSSFSSFFLSEFSSCCLSHFSPESTAVFAGRSREIYSLEISNSKNSCFSDPFSHTAFLKRENKSARFMDSMSWELTKQNLKGDKGKPIHVYSSMNHF